MAAKAEVAGAEERREEAIQLTVVERRRGFNGTLKRPSFERHSSPNQPWHHGTLGSGRSPLSRGATEPPGSFPGAASWP